VQGPPDVRREVFAGILRAGDDVPGGHVKDDGRIADELPDERLVDDGPDHELSGRWDRVGATSEQVVEDGHAGARVRKPAHERPADEPRAAGDEDAPTGEG